jgi:hypothetical protein
VNGYNKFVDHIATIKLPVYMSADSASTREIFLDALAREVFTRLQSDFGKVVAYETVALNSVHYERLQNSVGMASATLALALDLRDAFDHFTVEFFHTLDRMTSGAVEDAFFHTPADNDDASP